ncbi:sulfurtransferase complex subunit TusC [Microbulbifer sp. 2205BS26-8]|uniref:sulfurtransferase complex subunit TusC n=1 Tax=Microbulbifer sp. 2205BS26-8 TaxID=3064386 RepID=UPI00273DA80A|nr:sulfurtransferase complex subunit TusC [Microbulbifer sp. 2205BS26-8]MDP5211029.1 sulfurtransferase complex subunit TusC [Microbulbifer sp. 2205BS26-8]
MNQSTIALLRTPPYGSTIAREGLEAVLASAAMEQEIDLLFLGDGIFQLLDHQSPMEIGQKSLRRNLLALPVFGIEQIFVCHKSLRDRTIAPDQVQIPGVEVKAIRQPGALIAAYQCVLSF